MIRLPGPRDKRAGITCREGVSGKIGKCSSSLKPSTPGMGMAVPLVTTVGHRHLKSLSVVLFP